MNSTENIQRRSSFMNRLMKWSLLCGVLGFAVTQKALAADSTYTNDTTSSFPGTWQFPPQIDATNFVNTGSFTINFQTLTLDNQFFETSDTLNYTNTGSMSCNTGFNFDTQSTSSGFRTMAANFNNSGTISCASFNGFNLTNLTTSIIFGFGQFNAWATNIVNSGTVDVSADGLMQFSSMNADLSRSTLTMETSQIFDLTLANLGFNVAGFGVNASGSGVAGLNTNAWDPSVDLGQNFAESAPIPSPFFELDLFNSSAYFEGNTVNGTNVIRAVFVQDTSLSNVTYKVYFNTANVGVGNGDVTIEWAGSYVDPSSGNTLSNFLYLNNDYILGASTNVSLLNGFPDNLLFTGSSTQIPMGVPPTTAQFFNVYPPGNVTNLYSYGNVQLVGSSVGLGSVANGAITNLPGRIQINATNELDLSFAQILGPNYLSIQSPNQFDGSAGALIQTPYADINIGVTNGFLTVSNLMASTLPNWNGNIQAWNTRWISGSNDFRVLIVGSQITPTTVAQVQDLFLHATNSIVINDTFNILRNFKADAQNLTLATNGIGGGATSVDGELNLLNNSTLLSSALPNLLNLTNNGAIRAQIKANFGNPLVVNVVPSVAATAATGTLLEYGTNAVNNDKINIGTNQYIFVKTPNNSVANQIKIATSFDGSMNNLISAINGSAGSGTSYSTATKSNKLVTAGLLTGHTFTVTAIVAGATGNSIAASFVAATIATNFTWSVSPTLAGGTNFTPSATNLLTFPYNNFINNSLVSDQGSMIYANNFVNGGSLLNGANSFVLNSISTTMTNSLLTAGGDISITANTLWASGISLQAGRSLTLQVTNLFTDGVANLAPGGVTNGNFWTVGGASSVGLNLIVKPVAGDLLGTTITNIALNNKKVVNVWAGQDFGYSTAGFTNNSAIGRLILDASTNGVFVFNGSGGVGVSNAIYVDYLQLLDQATNRDAVGNPLALTNSANLVIYYASATLNGVLVSEKLNHKNNNHLRWVPSYVGNFSSTNLVINGVTNTVNIGLAQSTSIDSDGDGIPNAFDSTPFFTSAQVNLMVTVTNSLPPKAQIQWQTIPGATNYVFYKTNLLSSSWLVLTNFVTSPAPPYAPITDILYDTVGNPDMQRFYRVQVNLNTTNLYGP